MSYEKIKIIASSLSSEDENFSKFYKILNLNSDGLKKLDYLDGISKVVSFVLEKYFESRDRKEDLLKSLEIVTLNFQKIDSYVVAICKKNMRELDASQEFEKKYGKDELDRFNTFFNKSNFSFFSGINVVNDYIMEQLQYFRPPNSKEFEIIGVMKIVSLLVELKAFMLTIS